MGARGLAVFIAAALLGPSAAGAARNRAIAPLDTTTVGRTQGFQRPFWVMMRSAVIPGWGQLYNRKYVKAVLLGGAHAAFIYGVINEDHLSVYAARHAGMTNDPDLQAYWSARSRSHWANKKDYTWWGAFTILLSVGDAYVDAHLRGFNAEFRQEDSAVLLSYEVRL